MHVHRTVLILGAVFCAIVGGVADRFAVGRHFSAERPAAFGPLDNSPDQPRSSVDVSLVSVDGEAAPEKLPAPADASPILPSTPEQDAIARTIIRQELPDVTPEEREIWLEQVRGMPAQKIRDLLRLRRMFGSQQPFKTSKLPRPAQIPATPPDPGDSLVPRPLSEPDRQNPIYGRGGNRPDFHDEAVARFQPTFAALREARDVILNNIANTNTTGFKRSRVVFADLPFKQTEVSGRQDSQGRPIPTGIAGGLGVEVVATQLDHTPGSLKKTGGRFDLAIVGDGFFQIQDGCEVLYTRSGSFTLDAEGRLVLVNSRRSLLLEPTVTLPADSTAVRIAAAGVVSIHRGDGEKAERFGQIELARFVNPAGLERRGGNLFSQTEASLPPQVGNPGTAGRGKLRQGWLETSNVDLESELARLASLEKQWQALSQALPLRSPTEIAHGRRAK